MTTEDYEKVISTICEWGDRIVGEAGKAADIGVKKRWLTEFDVAIERAIAHEIAQLPGKHVLFAEEEHTTAPEGESIWILDPVSSTISFIRGIPLFSTVISHVINGVTVFAAVYDPNRKELFTASKGVGAFLGDKKIKVEEPTSDLFVHCMPAHKSFSKERCIDIYSSLLDLGSVRMSGMSEGLAYAYVACGRYSGAVGGNIDVFPAWAGRLLVEEAGGCFTDFAGDALTFDPHGTVSGSHNIHARLLEISRSFKY
jgi:myo-inositol-1(or 4)-monophosphatase